MNEALNSLKLTSQRNGRKLANQIAGRNILKPKACPISSKKNFEGSEFQYMALGLSYDYMAESLIEIHITQWTEG